MAAKSDNPIRLGIIGCGAVSERLHIPAALASSCFQLTALADKNTERLAALARAIPGAVATATDYESVMDMIDAAVVAVPNPLHKAIACRLLEAGKHVLVEKPMALTSADCEAMIHDARRNNRVLSVMLAKRFFHAHRYAKQLVDAGILGKIESFDFRNGTIYNWPIVSDSRFHPRFGGVLADTGSHDIDLLLWFLGDYTTVTYYDDAHGGVEADCRLEVTLKNGARGVMEFSRTRRLDNGYTLKGTKGTLQVGGGWARPVVKLSFNGNLFVEGQAGSESGAQQPEYLNIVHELFEDFGHAIRENREPFVNGEEGAKGVRLIEDCYNNRRTWALPWSQ